MRTVLFSEILRLASLAQDDRGAPSNNARTRVAYAARDDQKEANAPLPSASPTPSPKGEGEISIALSTLEKAKTALFAFSPCSGELREERVNLRGVFILNNTQKTAKSHFCRFSLMSTRMGVNVPRVL